MPRGDFSGSLTSPKIDVIIGMGNPFLNRTVDGFLKIGAVGPCKVAAKETFEWLNRGDVSKHKLEHAASISTSGKNNGAVGGELEPPTGRRTMEPLLNFYDHEREKEGLKVEDDLTLKKMCKKGAYGGSVAGVYVGLEYGMERIRGCSD